MSRKGCGFDSHSGHCGSFLKFLFFAPIAQLVEQIPLKDKVVGSIPTGRTALRKICTAADFLAVRTAAMFCEYAKPRGTGCENFL